MMWTRIVPWGYFTWIRKRIMFSVAKSNNQKKIYALRRVSWKNVRTQHAHSYISIPFRHPIPFRLHLIISCSHSVSNIVWAVFHPCACEWRLPIRWKTMSIFHEVLALTLTRIEFPFQWKSTLQEGTTHFLCCFWFKNTSKDFVWLSLHQKK